MPNHHVSPCVPHIPLWPDTSAGHKDDTDACNHRWTEDGLCPCGYCYLGRCQRCDAHYFAHV